MVTKILFPFEDGKKNIKHFWMVMAKIISITIQWWG
jgi:predicted DNA-binding WGR domain protein